MEFLTSLVGYLPAGLFGFGLQLGIWLLKRAGAKAETLQAFEDGVRSIQAKRAYAVRPMTDEAASRAALEAKLKGGKP